MDNISGSKSSTWFEDASTIEKNKTKVKIEDSSINKQKISPEFIKEIDKAYKAIDKAMLMINEKYNQIPNRYLGDMSIFLQSFKTEYNRFKNNLSFSTPVEKVITTEIIKEDKTILS